MEPKKFKGVSASWVQSYTTMAAIPYNFTNMDAGQIYNELTKESVKVELEILDVIDHLVKQGLTSPVADTILKKLFTKGETK
tara:strand:+ start:4231 stop:4476 length:246 start_codon:yes stop_codon:yes gene_type:complete